MKATPAKTVAHAHPSFHVLNGDGTLALLRKTAVPGEFLVWPDMLMEGPLKRGQNGRPDSSSRAAFLSSDYGVPRRVAAERLRVFAKALEAASRSNGEVTLWFEEDFFCQANLVGPLAARDGFAAWPLLKKGLKAHLDRRPSASGPRKGLGSLEGAIMDSLPESGNAVAFPELFRKVADHPRIRPLGLGDAQVARCLLGMAALSPTPIGIKGLRTKGSEAGVRPGMDFRKWRLSRP